MCQANNASNHGGNNTYLATGGGHKKYTYKKEELQKLLFSN